MSGRVLSFLIYAVKCGSGTLLIFFISPFIPRADINWGLISVVLVLSADGKDSLTLAITRIKANIVGVTIGVVSLLITPTNMWILSLALVITLCLCYIFKLDAGIRSSLCATIIIMLHPAGSKIWETATERVVSVLTGCIVGLAVTFIFHFKERTFNKPIEANQQEA